MPRKHSSKSAEYLPLQNRFRNSEFVQIDRSLSEDKDAARSGATASVEEGSVDQSSLCGE